MRNKFPNIVRTSLLTLPAILVMGIVLFNCSGVSMVQQDDLYQSEEEMVKISDYTPSDEGYKSPKKREDWELVWHDEFNGKYVDTTKWSKEVSGRGGGNNELQFYTDSRKNSYLKDGYLFIKGIKESYRGKSYTSARLRTKYKGDWKYGRFDIRAKSPRQQGMWPAIWMLPTDEVYGGWPKSGEIDIMEIIGQEPATLHGTVHYGPEWPDNQHTGASYKMEEGDFSQEFHVYSVEWEPGEIRWYVDGKHFSTKTPKDLEPHRWPFDQRFHMILNLAIGGDWPGPPNANTEFPKYFVIDYVRVYEKEDNASE